MHFAIAENKLMQEALTYYNRKMYPENNSGLYLSITQQINLTVTKFTVGVGDNNISYYWKQTIDKIKYAAWNVGHVAVLFYGKDDIASLRVYPVSEMLLCTYIS